MPSDQNSHTLSVVADPGLTSDVRDRSNNITSKCVVLPDLAIETCWSDAISSTVAVLVARVVNSGVISAGVFNVSCRLGSSIGEEIGRVSIAGLAPRSHL